MSTTAAPRSHQIRIVLGAVLGLSTGFTPVYFSTLALFLVPITDDFGWNRTQLASAGALSLLGAAVATLLVGRVIARLGARWTVLGSVLLVSLGMLLMAAAPARTEYFLILALLMGAVAGGSSAVAYLSLMPRYFDQRLGLALGITMTGVGVGASLIPILTGALIAGGGWRNAYVVLAVITATGGLLSVVIGFPKGTGGPEPKVKAALAGAGRTVREAIRSGKFLLLWGVLFVAYALGLGFSVNAAAFSQDNGLTLQQAAGAATAAGLGLLAGRLTAGLVMDRIHAAVIGGTFIAFGASGYAILVVLPVSLTTVTISAVLVGLSIGGEGDLMPYLARRYFGSRHFTGVFAVLYSAYFIGGLLGAIVFSATYDLFGSYDPIITVAAVGAVLAAVALQFAGPYRFPAGEPVPEVVKQPAADPAGA